MKLVRLYSNRPDVFPAIDFNSGLSVVLAEIRLPKNKDKHVHNLGKSTVGLMIDFCLLKGKHKDFFLFKHANLFEGFVFFLEVVADDGSYITISRSLEKREAIGVLVSPEVIEDATELQPGEWTHLGLGFAAAKSLLDGLFGFSSVSPWDYRDILSYVLREQPDYGDVFHLRKFRGKHSEWKPFLAHILGFDASLSEQLYEELEREEQLKNEMAMHMRDAGPTNDAEVTTVDGLIAIRRRDAADLEATLASFDFSTADAEANRDLVDRVESEIAQLNEETYKLSQLIKKLDESLEEEKIFFSTNQAEELFEEAGVAFAGQLKRDFDQLIQFNRAITSERRAYLLEEKAEAEARLAEVQPRLSNLQAERARLFEFLESSDTIAKYKELSSQLVTVRAQIESLTRQRDALARVVELRQEQRQVVERKNHLLTAIENDVTGKAEDSSSLYSEIQRYFDEIIHDVLDEHALLSVSVNSTGTLAFSAEIVSETGTATSAARGFTYNKLLCVAFDLAVLRAHLNVPFPRFAFHDGVFESLETRKKRSLLRVLREYAGYGLQPIITSLDSDLADPIGAGDEAVQEADVIRTLHDDGEGGRLFRMASW
jgi:uncharacterized protein YydD (DUF2326 family)